MALVDTQVLGELLDRDESFVVAGEVGNAATAATGSSPIGSTAAV